MDITTYRLSYNGKFPFDLDESFIEKYKHSFFSLWIDSHPSEFSLLDPKGNKFGVTCGDFENEIDCSFLMSLTEYQMMIRFLKDDSYYPEYDSDFGYLTYLGLISNYRNNLKSHMSLEEFESFIKTK